MQSESDTPLGPRVRDLIDRGLIHAPAVVRGVYKGTIIQATIDSDGSFVWNAERFSSPSVAAGRMITAISGDRTPGRGYLSINGWKFWSVKCTDGEFRALIELRDSPPNKE